MKKHIIILIVIPILFCECRENGLFSQSLNHKLDLISKLEYFSIGPFEFGDPDNPNLNHPYFYLIDSVSIDTLTLLADYPNQFVKLYAFKALQEKVNSSLFDIIKKHLSDSMSIKVKDDDYIFNTTVADIFIWIGEDYLLSSQRFSIRDSILFKYNNIPYIKEILFNLKPENKYYDVVKQLAKSNFGEEAFIALATYQKIEDISLIEKGFKCFNIYRGDIYKIVELFPSENFLPFLFDIHSSKLNHSKNGSYNLAYYYKALAKYHNKECFKILEEMSQRKYYYSDEAWRSNLIQIYESLYKYPHEMYKPLQAKLKQEIQSYDYEHKNNAVQIMSAYDFERIDTMDYRDKTIWW